MGVLFVFLFFWQEEFIRLAFSVPDPWHFDADPDPDSWIRIGTLDYGSGSFCSWHGLSRCQQKPRFLLISYCRWYGILTSVLKDNMSLRKITCHWKVTNQKSWFIWIFLLVDGRIRSLIRIRTKKIRIWTRILEAQKQTGPMDPDSEQCLPWFPV